MTSGAALSGSGRFAPGMTAGYAALWLIVVVQGWGPLVGEDPVERLYYPESAAERSTSRDLDIAYAVDASPAMVGRALGVVYGTREDTLLVAIDIQRQVVDLLEERGLSTDAAQARLTLLLRESGQADAATEVEEPVLSGWYQDQAQRDDAAVIQRGNTLTRRSLAVLAANALLVVFGAALLASRVRFLGELLRGDGGAPGWSFEDGIGVFVRGEFWNRFFFLALGWVWAQPFGATFAESLFGTILQTGSTLFASLPMLWLVHRHLLVPARRTAVGSFGLDARPGTVVRVALCAIAIDLAGTHALAWSSWGLGFSSSWAEGFDEMLVWGSAAEAFLTSADYVVWAPVMEELAFRGLLYYTLRHRLAPLPAAIVTALLFAALHFYSLPGFLMTLWSGLVWALAFERLRSLLPGIGAHAAYNALYVAGFLLLYR